MLVTEKKFVRQCSCEKCLKDPLGQEAKHHADLNFFMVSLDEKQRRLCAALESRRLGYGGDTIVSKITGLDVKTIRRGREELEHQETAEKVRKPGAGAPLKKKDRYLEGTRRTRRR